MRLAAANPRRRRAPAPNLSPVTSLQKVTLKPGTGAAIGGGQIAVVQYTGWLYEAGATDHKGKQFDSSLHAPRAL